MSILSAISDWLTGAEPERTLSAVEPWPLSGVGRLAQAPIWTAPSVESALSVPSIFRAVSLIATVTGSLSMQALRKGQVLDPAARPQVIVRPDPARRPRPFFRDTAWNLAAWGEAWWYVSARDRDGIATSLYNVPSPVEVSVRPDPSDPVRPVIEWRGRSTADGTLRRDDIVQLTLLTDGTGLRGRGPLQWCGAAASVSVASQEWAANFYARGGYPSIIVRSALPLGGGDDGWSDAAQSADGAESEAERFARQWGALPANTPRVIDPGIESVSQLDVSASSAQALEARAAQNGEAARMFGIPGVLLEFVQAGSSLTYQNIETVFAQWIKTGLRPLILEEVEQAMSDLLTGPMAARFNLEQLQMPDQESRFRVYASGIASGIITAEYAQAREGIVPGDVENAPVPRPQAPAPALSRPSEVRCRGDHPDLPGRACNKLLSTTGRFEGRCPRCGRQVAVAA